MSQVEERSVEADRICEFAALEDQAPVWARLQCVFNVDATLMGYGPDSNAEGLPLGRSEPVVNGEAGSKAGNFLTLLTLAAEACGHEPQAVSTGRA